MKDFDVVFAEQKVKDAFEELKKGKFEDKQLYENINKAISALKQNPFCGIQIPKKLIPAAYLKIYTIDNLWKYNLPSAWRLLYSVTQNELKIISVILAWMSHKNYERRFGYD